MKKLIFIIGLGFLMACASKKNQTPKKGYEITTNKVELNLEHEQTKRVNELRLSTQHNSRDLQRFMFEKYGKWDSKLKTNVRTDYLVWSDVKLLEDQEELFTVMVGGVKEKRNLPIKVNDKSKYFYIEYATAIVFDAQQKDLLATTSSTKNNIIDFLVVGANSVKKKNKAFKKALKSN